MKTAFLFGLLALPLACFAKGETTRIEIARGKRVYLVLEQPTARQFTIWSGPGTSTTSGDGASTEPLTTHDFADWSRGPVDEPDGLEVYKVRIFCAASGDTPKEQVPSHQCYGVRYAFDSASGIGYVQIPKLKDRDFPDNARTIYRGVEGSWYRATLSWDSAVQAAMDERAARDEAAREASRRYQEVYIPSTPSSRAVSATPKVTPKTR